jgi:uncharacterized protein YmfQ (DUF2313 family)
MSNRRRWLSTFASAALILGMSVATGPPAQAASPSNDDFVNAIALPSTSGGSTTGSNLDATMETDEPLPWNNYVATAWWQWTAPSSGTYQFDTCGTNFQTGLGIWTGTAVDALTDVRGAERECYYGGTWYWNDAREMTAVGGETYYLQVAGNYGAMGDVVLRWWPQVVPANDDFADAESLPSQATGSLTTANRFATSETGEPAFLAGRGSVWWTWTAPAAGDYMFDTCGSNIDSRIGVYTGLAVDALTLVADGDDECSWQSEAVFTATQGTTYYIGAGGWGTYDFGDLVVRWQSATVPSNDDFSNATALSGTASGSVSGNNRFATTEGYEPDGLGESTVWWTWTAPSSGSTVIDTCGSNFETQLGVYEGDGLGALTETTYTNAYGCFLGSMVRFDAIAGTPYRIAVGTYDGPGDIALSWQQGTPSANDDFASAQVLSGSGGTATGSTMFATKELGEPGYSLHTVWFSWAAPDVSSATFDTCGSAVPEARMAIYTGSAVNALTPVSTTASTSCGHETEVFTPVPGQVYRIAVASYDDGMGDIVLHWPASGTAAVAPAVTTHPSSTTVLSGVSAQFTAEASGDPTPTVQWQLSTNSGSTWGDLTGSTSTTLDVATTYAKNGYQYRAVFTNIGGTATTDAATLTVSALAPSMSAQPSNASVGAGLPASFTAAATGDPTPTVQWLVSTDSGSTWDNVSDATSGTLTLSPTTLAMNGYQYHAVFTNPGGSVTSDAATLTVIDPSNASVTTLVAAVSKGSITITFSPSGTPTPTQFQCMLSGGGAKLTTWTACTSGFKVKSGGKTASVRAGWNAGGPWGTAVTVDVTRK